MIATTNIILQHFSATIIGLRLKWSSWFSTHLIHFGSVFYFGLFTLVSVLLGAWYRNHGTVRIELCLYSH